MVAWQWVAETGDEWCTDVMMHGHYGWVDFAVVELASTVHLYSCYRCMISVAKTVWAILYSSVNVLVTVSLCNSRLHAYTESQNSL